MKTKIEQIWKDLENDKSFSRGILLRRYSGDFLPDVFLAIKSPENYRCIAATISSSIKIDISSFSNLKDIIIELIPDEKYIDKNILLLKLVNSQFNDIFSVLCEDLIASISSIKDESLLIKKLLNRFEKWKSLFDKATTQGLNPKEQRGLFGELFFLRIFLQVNTNYSNVMTSWVGPEKQIRDFQLKNWGVEVKTTCGNNHQIIQINSERQLDISNLEYLYLFHISLEISQRSGETLNQLVDSIYNIFNSDLLLANSYTVKLYEAGYFKHHKDLYEDIGYFVRQRTFYKIVNEFPRIEEKDIRNGVGDVKYTITVSQCTNFIETEEQAFKIIITNE